MMEFGGKMEASSGDPVLFELLKRMEMALEEMERFSAGILGRVSKFRNPPVPSPGKPEDNTDEYQGVVGNLKRDLDRINANNLLLSEANDELNALIGG